MAADEDLEDQHKERPPITIDTINKRTHQYSTANLEQTLNGFRLTKRSNCWYLERIADAGTTYSGVYIPTTYISQLADMFSSARDEELYG